MMQHHLIDALTILNILFEEIFGKVTQILHIKMVTSYFPLLLTKEEDIFASFLGRFSQISKGVFLSMIKSSISIYQPLLPLIKFSMSYLLQYLLSIKPYYQFQQIMLIKIYTCVILLCLFNYSHSKVTQLTLNNFDGSLYFVQVYEDNCPNCNVQQKQLQDVSKLMDKIVRVGKINLKNIPAMKGQKLPNNPSYFFVKGSIQDFSEYKQKVSRISITKFILLQLEKFVKSKDSKLFGSKKSGSESSKTGKNSEKKSKNTEKDQSGVTILTDANFEETVLKSDQAWFVQFYSPSCGHCHALQPEWDKLPSKIGKRVRIAKIDATVHRQMAQKFQIKGFPTLLFFGLEDKSSPVPYQSQRTSQAMVSWLLTQKIADQKLEFLKLTKQSYGKECNRNIVCLVFILDKKSELKDLDFIQQIMEQNKGKPLRFFYSSRLIKFEQALMIQDRSTPKLVSIWDSLNSYKVYNSGMSHDDISKYITKIMERKSWVKLNQKVPSILFSENSEQL